MKFDGTSTEFFGLVVLRTEGFFDMPQRMDPVVYDWGDEIQPLLLAEQIFFAPQMFKVDFLFDYRLTASSFSSIMDAFKNSYDEFELEITGAGSDNGKFMVKLLDVIDERRRKNFNTLTMVFSHRVPSFPASLPSVPGTVTNMSLGGYNFSQFGLSVSARADFDAVATLKDSVRTVYMSGGAKASYRGLKTISMDCWIVGQDRADMINKVSQFKKLLSSPGAKVLKYGAFEKNVFCSDGFKADVMGKRAVKFVLKLNEI